MAHGPYWSDLAVDAAGKHYVTPAKWDQLVDSIVAWKGPVNASGQNLSNVGQLSFAPGGGFSALENLGFAADGMISTSGPWKIRDGVAGNDRIVIDASGNVGVGTASPSHKLQVATTGADTINWAAAFSNPYAGATTGFGAGIKLQVDNPSGGNWYQGHKWAGIAAIAEAAYGDKIGLAFYTQGNLGSSPGNAPTEKLRIDSIGNVGIGTATPKQRVTIAGDVGLGTFDSSAPVNRVLAINTAGASNYARLALTVGTDLGTGASFWGMQYKTDVGSLQIVTGSWFSFVGGPVAVTVPAAAPADSLLAAGQAMIWFDEVANRLVFRCKNSAGTLKTGYVNVS